MPKPMIETVYFKQSEFACKCGCGTCNVNQEFVNRLDLARRLAGVPFPINSGCRCQKHNAKVGGEKNSSHLSGPDRECFAVDIGIFDSVSRYRVIRALLEAGFDRLGVGKSLIHVDSDPSKEPHVIWTYPDK